MTMNFLKSQQLPFDEIIFDSFDKLKDCLDRQIELMVDDSVKNCEDLVNGGVQAVLFSSSVNTGIATNLYRVKDWGELETYLDHLAK
jgi:uncharacterized HAD superfamily protein